MKQINMEDPKRDIHVPMKKGGESSSAEQIRDMGKGRRSNNNENGRGRGITRT